MNANLRAPFSKNHVKSTENRLLKSLWHQPTNQKHSSDRDISAIISMSEKAAITGFQEKAEELAGNLAQQMEAENRNRTLHRKQLESAQRFKNPILKGLCTDVPKFDGLDDVLAVGIDPEDISGIDLRRCDRQIISTLGRTIVQPLASKFLFWKKSDEIKSLRQSFAEGQALTEQLKGIIWDSGAALVNGAMAPGCDALASETQSYSSRSGEIYTGRVLHAVDTSAVRCIGSNRAIISGSVKLSPRGFCQIPACEPPVDGLIHKYPRESTMSKRGWFSSKEKSEMRSKKRVVLGIDHQERPRTAVEAMDRVLEGYVFKGLTKYDGMKWKDFRR